MLVILDGERKRSLYSPAFAGRLGGHDSTAFVRRLLGAGIHPSKHSPLEHVLATDVGTYLVGNQLAYADRMSMAQSLEVRVPFVDQRLAAVAARIPFSWHLHGQHGRGGQTKALLREAVAPWLPQEIVQGAKRGLNLPIGLWLRRELKDWMRDLLSPRRLESRGVLQGDAVGGIIAEHLGGQRDHSLFLWSLIVLELWFQRYEPPPISA